MPIYRKSHVVEIRQNLKAFLRFDVGLVRGAVPDFEQMFKQVQSQVEQKNRQLKQMRQRLKQSQAKQPAGTNERPQDKSQDRSYEEIYEAHVQSVSADVAIGGDSFNAELFDSIGRLELEVLKKEALKPTDTLVDLGCGTGRLAVHAIPTLVGGHYIGIDIAQSMLDEAQERVEGRIPDPPCRVSWIHQRTPVFTLDDNSVDMICAFSVINHMEHEDGYLYLKEALRVVRPGGRFIFSCLPINTTRAQEVFFRSANMDLQKRRSRIPHVATSKDFMADIARLAGWTTVRWYDGDEEHFQLPDQEEPRRFGQSIFVLEVPHEDSVDGAPEPAPR